MNPRRAPPPLCALTPGDARAFPPARILGGAAELFAAGVRGLVVREPELSDRAYLELFGALRRLAQAHETWLAVHDRAHLATALGAAAVHLGWRSLSPGQVRPWIPADVAVGLSTHASDERAAWREADYLFHGPVFETPSKQGLVEPVGLDGFAAAVRDVDRPLWALGGVRPEHVRTLFARGAAGVAVLGGLWHGADLALSAQSYLAACEGRRD